MAGYPKTRTEIEKLLITLRDAPVDTEGASDVAVLAPIYDFLMNIPQSAGGGFHWFCDKCDALTVEAATFLIRLFAYSSSRVDAWKQRFEGCLNGCSGCVEGFENAKYTSVAT
jgi:senataxin